MAPTFFAKRYSPTASTSASEAIAVALAHHMPGAITLQADGSGMYTVQAVWTRARERLDVVTIVFATAAIRY